MKRNKNAFRWICIHSKFILFPLILLCAISFAMSMCSVSFAVLSRELIDTAVGQMSGSLAAKAVSVAALVGILLLLQVSYSYLNVRVSGKLEIKLRKTVFSSLLCKDLTQVTAMHSGDLMNRLTSDITIITSAVVGILPTLLSFVTRLGAAAALLLWEQPLFLAFYLVFGLLFMGFTRIYSKRMKRLHKMCQDSEGKTRSFMQEALQNILAVKAFRNESEVTNYSSDLQEKNFRLKMKRNTISIIANIFTSLAFTAGYYFAMIWGAFQLFAGAMSYGTLVFMLQLVNQIQTPFRGMSALLPQYYSALASAERLLELEELNQDAPAKVSYRTYHTLEEIRFENLSFSYGEEPVLQDLNLTVKQGDFTAITGISGIGKSTLLKLLLGVLKPVEGKVLLTSDAGTQEAGWETRALFAYVPQGNLILSGTIRENIVFFHQAAKEEEIIRAAKAAEIYDFIMQLPQKFDTVLGEKGLGLSEGQVQRLAIARAVLHDAPILLLDEATSSLDEKTERAILNHIKEWKTKTLFIVSHRPSALEICNHVIHLEKGKAEIKKENGTEA